MLRYAQKAVRGGKEVCILVLVNQLQKREFRSRRKSPESNINITGHDVHYSTTRKKVITIKSNATLMKQWFSMLQSAWSWKKNTHIYLNKKIAQGRFTNWYKQYAKSWQAAWKIAQTRFPKNSVGLRLGERFERRAGCGSSTKQLLLIVDHLGFPQGTGGLRVAEVAREHGWHPPKSLDSDENFKPEHTLFCRELRFVAIYALFFGDLWP